MVDLINEWFLQFNAYTKSNPVVAGIVSLWGLGVITFFLKDIPSRISMFLKRQLTTTLVLNSQDTVFYQTLNWVSENQLHKFVRVLNAHNGKRGYGAQSSSKTLSMGFGTMLFFFRKRLFIFRRVEKDANQTEFTKEQISITLVGRDHSIFQHFIKEVNTRKEKDLDYVHIYTFKEGKWVFTCKQFKRSLNTVIIDSQVKETLLSFIDKYNKSKDWYVGRGIPYRTGILLTGPTGTGKTSLIKGLCSFYNKDLYIINNLNQLTGDSLDDALSSLPQGCIVAIEDIDSQGVDLTNTDVSAAETPQTTKQELVKPRLTISNILNAIDGVTSAEDRILLATTNHPERLAKSLVREGRFDLKLEVGYVTDEMLREYTELFYQDFSFPEDRTVLPEVAMCAVQKLMLDNKDDPSALLAEVTEHRFPEPIVVTGVM